MVNKLTIESSWRTNPNKIYHVIQNPRVDTKNKKMIGLTIKSVEYKVVSWDKDVVTFEKINIDDNKRFPDNLIFDKRYPDAENEVYAERVSKAKVKPKAVDSYGIFIDKKMAKYHKLIRLHRVAEQMKGIYKAIQGKSEKMELSESDNETTKKIKESADTNTVDFSLEDVKKYFEEIQNTGYFEELEIIQSEFPDLAVK